MKNKVYLVIILIFSIFISGCSIDSSNKIRKDQDGFIIGTSNKENNNKMQVKVIIGKINIRKEAGVNSDKVGIVEKGTILDVIEYKMDEKYIWFKIKTDNNIEGYIASEKESPYVEINKEIDYTPPEINIKENKVTVNDRNAIEQAVANNVEYKDENDKEPKLEYNVNYDKKIGDFEYLVEVKVTDSSNNSSKGKFNIEITGEKQMKDGNWLSYQEIISKQNQAKSLCYKYGLEPFTNGLRGCFNSVVFVESSPYIVLSPERCFYNTNFEPTDCSDLNGNKVNHDLMSANFKAIENKWSEKIKNYYRDVINDTGYELSELYW